MIAGQRGLKTTECQQTLRMHLYDTQGGGGRDGLGHVSATQGVMRAPPTTSFLWEITGIVCVQSAGLIDRFSEGLIGMFEASLICLQAVAPTLIFDP